MTMPIEVEHLQLRYGDVDALNDLTFTLTGGKIYGLLGRNGSGKTSLLSVLAAFRKASGGLRIGGQPVFENPQVTRQVCFISATGATTDKSDKVKDALEFAEYLRPNWDTMLRVEVDRALSTAVGQRVADLSLGQQSALGIVIGLAARAPLTIFDELYLGMDVPSRIVFHDELLTDFMANPRTIIMSTHLIEELSALFEEVIIIDGGRLLLPMMRLTIYERAVTSVTGPAEAVDRFVAGLTVIGEKQLGRTKSTMVFGVVGEHARREAHAAGLEFGPLTLQELFVHLTGSRQEDTMNRHQHHRRWAIAGLLCSIHLPDRPRLGSLRCRGTGDYHRHR